MVTWTQCAADFVGDGSLRDVYVIDGGLEAWNALFAIARRCGARFSFQGVTSPLPEDAGQVFVLGGPGAALLSIDWHGIELVAHFFEQSNMELDFVPTALNGQESLDLLSSFLRELAAAVKRDVIVTPENWPQSPILRARPTGEVGYEAPKDAA